MLKVVSMSVQYNCDHKQVMYGKLWYGTVSKFIYTKDSTLFTFEQESF